MLNSNVRNNYPLADLGGGLPEVATPLWSENFTQKMSFFAIFRTAPPSFQDRMVDKSSHERLQSLLSKISRSTYVTYEEVPNIMN